MLTVPPHRGTGLGRVVMREGIARTRAAWPGQPIRIAAQQRLEAFYASLGFRTVSAPYDEDGIAHVDMLVDATYARAHERARWSGPTFRWRSIPSQSSPFS